MSFPSLSLGWDDTIRPAPTAALSSTFNSLSLSPENKRKRRLEDATSNGSHSPQGFQKRTRFSVPKLRTRNDTYVGIRRHLEALDKEQLISLVEELVEKQPYLHPIVEQLAPPLSVQQALSTLVAYRHEIFNKIPLGDNSGDYAFLRVRPQWTSFFVALAEYTFAFLQKDPSKLLRTLEFLDGATSLVHEIPLWSTARNNYLLNRAYCELGQAWQETLDQAVDSLPFALMTSSAWESRFHDHCERSRGKMSSTRAEKPTVDLVRLCQGVTS